MIWDWEGQHKRGRDKNGEGTCTHVFPSGYAFEQITRENDTSDIKLFKMYAVKDKNIRRKFAHLLYNISVIADLFKTYKAI